MTSHTALRGHWCDIIVLKAHPPTKDKSDNSKHSSYEELEQVFKHLTKYNVRILLEDFNAKLGRKDICGWSEKFLASIIDGNNIGKIFFSKLVHLS
jgi:hypothetical protein